jgi:hypothetical protein
MLAAARAAAYARLEEIRFRTGMAVIIGVMAVIGGSITAVLVTGQGGPAARTPASLAGRVPVAVPQRASAAPSASLAQARPRPRRQPARPAAKRVSRPAAAPAAGVPAAVPRPAARRVPPSRHDHGPAPSPGWWWRWAWQHYRHDGWPHGGRWHAPPGWPRWWTSPGDGAGRPQPGGD